MLAVFATHRSRRRGPWRSTALTPLVTPVILGRMKTAVSLPDDLFRLIDARARALKISRSALLARAAREFLEKGTPAADVTAAWNTAIDSGGQPGDDPAALAFRRRAKRVLRTGKAKKR